MSLHRARARDRHPSMATAGSELHRLCRSGDLSAIRSYLTETAVSGVLNKVAGLNGCTPLHEAAMAGRADVVTLLREDCQDSLDINVRTQRGPASTPLHLASERGHVECVMALLECGSVLDMVDRRCRTAKDVAIEHGRRQVTFTIAAAEMEHAVDGCDVKRMQELLPQMTTTSKLTQPVKQWRQQRLNLALRKACILGNYKIVVLLIRAGANNFTECIQGHQRLNHIIAFLRLCQAAQEDDRDTIQSLLSGSEDDHTHHTPHRSPAPHLQEFHQILMPLLDNGKLSVAEPLHVALRADHINTAGHILLKAAKHPSSGMLNWQDLGLEQVSSMWIKSLEHLNLSFLSLSFNKLTLIPPEIANLRNLVKIQLANNCISFVPSELFQLPKIESIDLSYNAIRSLPEALLGDPSPALATLHVSNNQLTSFPSYFSKTGSLVDLDISHNCLPEVSENICNLEKLERLNLSENPDIRFIPYQLGGLSQLKMLSVEGLPYATNIPTSSEGSPPNPSMLEFVRNRFKTMLVVQHYEIVVIGFSNFQQTLDSLLGALKSADLGCSYLTYDNPVQFLHLHDIFKLQNSLYMVAWDCSSEQDVNSLHRILRHLSIYVSNVPIVVAACWKSYLQSHSELAVEESISQSLWGDLSDKILLRHVILEGGQGSEEYSIRSLLGFVRTVSEKTREVVHVPSSYVKCHENIRHDLSKSFLHNNRPPLLNEWDFWEVLRSMPTHDLSSHKELQDLVAFLTMKGTVLQIPCSKGDMQDYYVLNRQWLCNVLSNAVHHRSGSVGYGSVSAIVHHEGLIDLLSCSMLQDQQLPNGLRFLLNRQGITLALSSERWLVPSMLQSHPDPQVESFVEQFGIRRQYTFSLTPSTFWGRLISHLLINMERLVREVSLSSFTDSRRDTLTNRHGTISSPPPREGGGVIDWAYWRKGITCWQNARNLVYSIDAIPTRDEPFSEGLEIRVPDTPAGCRTMHILTYLIDNLFKNWYPTVWRSVEVWVPCSYCVHNQVKDVPSISFCDCLLAVSKGVGVKCIHHEKIVSISKIVPDLIYEDVSMDQFFPPGSVSFNIHDKPTCLSPAPFETVFKGMYSDKLVAVKPFPHPVPSKEAALLDVPPNLQAWHEFATLRHAMVHSNSPFVLQAIGMCPSPLCLIFPFAKFTSLDEVFESETQRITHLVRMRIVYQLSSALEALHSCNIIHRNVCLANILVNSLSADDPVNVKLGGFSDACYGIFQGVGTGCYGVYPAPEMKLKYMSEYDERIDIFAFAFVAYEIITRRKLLSSLPLPLEMSSSLQTRPTLSPIQTRAPHMVGIINRCWDPVASKRPFASDLVEHLKVPLHNVMRDGKLVNNQHECFATVVKFTRAQNSLCSDVYVCHGYLSSNCKVTLSHISLPGLNFKNSISLPNEYVICLGCVGSELWVSFNGRSLRVYSSATLELLKEYKFTHHIVVIAVSPTSVYLGLENGVLQVYDVQDNTPNDPLHTSIISQGQEFKTIEALEDCIVCATKTQIYRLHPDTLATESKWPVSVVDNEVRCIVVCDFEDEEDDIIWVSLRWNGIIQVLWNGCLRYTIDCSKIEQPEGGKVRVLTMKAVLDTVWVGLMSGHILVFSAREPKPTLLAQLPVHQEEARHLLLLQPSYMGPTSVMSASEMLHSMKHLSLESDKSTSSSSSSSNRFGIPESVCLVSFGQGLRRPLAELGEGGAVIQGRNVPFEGGLFAVVLDGMSTMRTWDLELRSGQSPLPYMEDLDKDSLYEYPSFVPDYQNTNPFFRTDTWTAGTVDSPVHVQITSPNSTLIAKRNSSETNSSAAVTKERAPGSPLKAPPIPPRSPIQLPPAPPEKPQSPTDQQQQQQQQQQQRHSFKQPPQPSSSNQFPPLPAPSPHHPFPVIKEPPITSPRKKSAPPMPLIEESSDNGGDVYYVAASVMDSLPPKEEEEGLLVTVSTTSSSSYTDSLLPVQLHSVLKTPPQILDSCESEDGYDPYVRMGSFLRSEKPSSFKTSASHDTAAAAAAAADSLDRESDDFLYPQDFMPGLSPPIKPPNGKATNGKPKSYRSGPKPKPLPKPHSLTSLTELAPSMEPHPLAKSTASLGSSPVQVTFPEVVTQSLEKVTLCDSTACVIQYKAKPSSPSPAAATGPGKTTPAKKKSKRRRRS